jgi:hypothetical protein
MTVKCCSSAAGVHSSVRPGISYAEDPHGAAGPVINIVIARLYAATAGGSHK